MRLVKGSIALPLGNYKRQRAAFSLSFANLRLSPSTLVILPRAVHFDKFEFVAPLQPNLEIVLVAATLQSNVPLHQRLHTARRGRRVTEVPARINYWDGCACAICLLVAGQNDFALARAHKRTQSTYSSARL